MATLGPVYPTSVTTGLSNPQNITASDDLYVSGNWGTGTRDRDSDVYFAGRFDAIPDDAVINSITFGAEAHGTAVLNQLSLRTTGDVILYNAATGQITLDNSVDEWVERTTPANPAITPAQLKHADFYLRVGFRNIANAGNNRNVSWDTSRITVEYTLNLVEYVGMVHI
jgi:hypothetical protein